MCPDDSSLNDKVFFNNKIEEGIDSLQEFWQHCPTGLANELKYVPWASSENCYKHLFRITCWAIDSLDISYELFQEVLWDRTFPKLLKAGYPKHKLLTGVSHAYSKKRKTF